MKKIKGFCKDKRKRLIALAVAAVMFFSSTPTLPTQAEDNNNPVPGSVVTVADPETLHRPIDIYGQNTLNAGKITVGKSVDTTGFEGGMLDGVSLNGLEPDANNFLVTLSQSAQAVGLSSKLPVPVDAVFVLDTSGSMKDTVDGTARYINMISAANDAINTLLAANDQNRIAVVAFSSKDSGDNEYGGGTSDGEAANVLSDLAHYDGEAATAHLQRVNAEGTADSDGQYVAGRNTETITYTEKEWQLVKYTDRWGNTREEWREVDVEKTKSVTAYRHARNGGTNIHAGIALGADILMNVTDTTAEINGEQVQRLPFVIVLSDGAPTYSSDAQDDTNTTEIENAWYNVDDVLAASQQGNGNTAYEGNGFLAALTASYYKGAITEKYFGVNASEDNRCSIYTIGIGLDTQSGGQGIDAADLVNLAEITMDPSAQMVSTNDYYTYGNTSNQQNNKSTFHSFKTYWENYAAGNDFTVRVGNNDTYTITSETIAATKHYVNGNRINTNNTMDTNDDVVVSMYAGGLGYNDEYFASSGSSTDLNNTFKELVRLIQIKAISLPTDTSVSADFGGYVHFYDPIGEYMEVKDVHGVVSDGRFFQGAAFAKNMVNYGTVNADAAFDQAMTAALNGRLELSGSGVLTVDDIKVLAEKAAAADGQLYYNSNDDYNNSFCWYGKGYTDANGDEHVQYLGFAKDDSIESIEYAKTATVEEDKIPAGAEYVCRSYYYYGTAGGAIAPVDDFLLLVVRVQRSLTAPYQETVYVSIPGNLLSVDRVLITEDQTKNPVTYESFVQAENPVRIIYEVGLQSNINAQNVSQVLAGTDYVAEKVTDKGVNTFDNYEAATNTYYFYTNDWDRAKSENSHERALAHAGFDAATDNEFYAFADNTILYTKNGDTYTPVTDEIQTNTTYYYARTYYDWTGKSAKDTAGTLFDCTPKTEYIAVVSPADKTVIAANTGTNAEGQKYIKAGTYTAYSLSAANDDTLKVDNNNSTNYTGTSTVIAHPMRTNDLTDSHYTVFLGNNGRLALTADVTKSVDIIKADNTVITDADGQPVTVGDTLTYTIKVVNTEGADTTATVTDKIPVGTELVEGSIDNGGHYDAATGKIIWNLELAKNSSALVSFQVVVTEGVLGEAVITLDNTATIKLANSPEYTTNTIENPPQGKKVTDVNTGSAPEGGVKIGQELIYSIEWFNYTDDVVDIIITDVIPEGTTVLESSISDGGQYANGKITWELKNVAADTSGFVNFTVVVNESAKTPIENGATIQIGDNEPEFITNKTENEVLTGDLQISKDVNVVSGTGSSAKEFELKLTTRSAQDADYATLNGTFTLEGSSFADSVTFVNGQATIKIKDGETITIKTLPAALEVNVEEVNVPAGYTAVYSSADQKVSVKPTGQATASISITNNYSATEVPVTLTGRKTLSTADGAYLGNTIFSFDVYSYDPTTGVVGDRVLNTAQATVNTDNASAEFSFATRKITAPGDYYYVIKEANTNIQGVTYDTTQYLVKVVVVDDGAGKLVIESTSYTTREGDSGAFTGIATGISFANSYEPKEISLNLTGTKVLTGRDLEAGEFAFVVTENGTPVSTGTLAANGAITFSPITFYAPGQHTYKITELDNNEANITYDSKEYTVFVKVEDVNGQLTITEQTLDGASVDAVHVTFHNIYVPSEVSVPLTGQKYYLDESGNALTLKGGEFTFAVDQTDASGTVIKTEVSAGQNDNTGKIAFTPITVKVKEGVTEDYTEKLYFNVREVIPTISKDPFMSYDESVYKVEITVNYEYSSGTLSAEVTDISGAGSTIAFTNTKHPDSITVQPQGFKTTNTTGGTLPEGISFSFAVKNVENGHTVYTGIAKGGTNEAIEFTKLSYSHTDNTQPAVYQYWIMESNTGNINNGIKYDTSRYLMTVTVSNTDGKLSADVKYYSSAVAGSTNISDYTIPVNGAPTFTNTYDAKGSINITATKELTGGLTMTADQFAFRLQRMAGLEGNETTGGVINGVNDANGKITFATLFYGLADIPDGQDYTIIRYKMSEIVPTINPIPGVTYDTAAYDIYVKLTQDGKGGITAQLCDKDGNVKTENPLDTGVVFRNSYAVVQGADVTITANKVLNGRELENGEFTFGLYYLDPANNNAERLVASATNDKDGNITFTRHYPATTAPGTYHYVIRELNDNKGGITYDGDAVNVSVELSVEAAVLKGEVSYSNNADRTFTNTYTAPDIYFTPEATKSLTGRDLEADEFSFQIVSLDDPAKPIVSVGQNAANGKITFSPIRYTDKAGTGTHIYKYAISEVAGTRGGVTYDKTIYYLQVTVADDGTGKLTATGKYYADEAGTKEASVVFNNSYTTGNGTVALEAHKTLQGADLEAAEFDFVITDLNDKVITTGDNAADGHIAFGTIGYTHADLEGDTSKTFTYWMYEVAPNGGKLNGITFAQNRYKVEVIVTDNSYGILNTEAKYYTLNEGAAVNSTDVNDYTTPVDNQATAELEVPSFINTYEAAKTGVTINAYKNLVGKKLQDKEFTFVLTDENNKSIEAVNDADGFVTFELKDVYDKAGTYKYTLTEAEAVNGEVSGTGTYTYDKRAYEIVVTVTDDGIGQLHATVAYTLNGDTVAGASFINSYTPKEITVDLSTDIGATKTVTDKDGQKVEITLDGSLTEYPVDGFTFVVTDNTGNPLTDAEGNPMKGISDKDGKITFPEFRFTESDEYHYWIYEEATDKGGITIDSQVWELHIRVDSNYANGNLEVTSVSTYPVSRSIDLAQPAFVNIYDSAPVSLTITADKQLEALKGSERKLQAHEFAFRVMEGEIIRAESYNDAEGNITFSFTETATGTHTYTIVEVIPTEKAAGMTYDEKTVGEVTVTVVDDGTGQLKIDGEAEVSMDSDTVFTNIYAPAETTVTISAKKILKGAELAADTFAFELVDRNTNEVVATAFNDGGGNITFTQTFEEVGQYPYLIREKKGDDSNITYDSTEYALMVDVKDNLAGQLTATVDYQREAVFINTYTPPSVPDSDLVYKSVAFTKIWDDNDNAAGKRPDSIVVEAYQDGVYVTDVVLSKDNGWFNAIILLVENGDHVYEWTIKEKNIPEGYTASYDQCTLTVTNTLKTMQPGVGVQTGDDSNIAVFLVVSLVSLIAVIGLIVLLKFRKKDTEE